LPPRTGRHTGNPAGPAVAGNLVEPAVAGNLVEPAVAGNLVEPAGAGNPIGPAGTGPASSAPRSPGRADPTGSRCSSRCWAGTG
jgi:hypothetical protein